MLKEAMLYEQLAGNKVRCDACARRCIIPEGSIGFCRVRKNQGGRLYSLVYGKACAANVDPITKKPLAFFHPGSSVMSIATVGCDFACKFCDNWVISQEREISGYNLSPQKVVELTKRYGCQGISYTYTEPTVFIEYAFDTARLAHEQGLFNTFVTNGYLTPEAVEAMAPYLDAATVDFKGGADPDFYKRIMAVPSPEPIFECLREMKRHDIHIEVSDLVVTKYGDSIDRVRELAGRIRDELGKDTPFHVLRFHPDFKLTDVESTPIKTLERACEAAMEEGLNYVLIGNVPGHKYENTYCPRCRELVIGRFGFDIVEWNVNPDNTCRNCGERISALRGRFYPGGRAYPYPIL